MDDQALEEETGECGIPPLQGSSVSACDGLFQEWVRVTMSGTCCPCFTRIRLLPTRTLRI